MNTWLESLFTTSTLALNTWVNTGAPTDTNACKMELNPSFSNLLSVCPP